jgi:hypothetical protein
MLAPCVYVPSSLLQAHVETDTPEKAPEAPPAANELTVEANAAAMAAQDEEVDHGDAVMANATKQGNLREHLGGGGGVSPAQLEAIKSMMQASQSESREQVSALQLTVAGQSAQIASLLSLVKSSTAQTVMKVDAIQIGVGARVQKMEEYLGTMTKQVSGALERTLLPYMDV